MSTPYSGPQTEPEDLGQPQRQVMSTRSEDPALPGHLQTAGYNVTETHPNRPSRGLEVHQCRTADA
jgi:hypothetical protein